jgi:hypothetical protein
MGLRHFSSLSPPDTAQQTILGLNTARGDAVWCCVSIIGARSLAEYSSTAHSSGAGNGRGADAATAQSGVGVSGVGGLHLRHFVHGAGSPIAGAAASLPHGKPIVAASLALDPIAHRISDGFCDSILLTAPRARSRSADAGRSKRVREILPQQITDRMTIPAIQGRRGERDTSGHVLGLAWNLSFSRASGTQQELQQLAGEEVLVLLTVVSEQGGIVGRVLTSVIPDEAEEDRWFTLRHEDGRAVKGKAGNNMAILLRFRYSDKRYKTQTNNMVLGPDKSSQGVRAEDTEAQDTEVLLQLRLAKAAQVQAAHDSMLSMLQGRVEDLKAQLSLARCEASRSREGASKMLSDMRLLVDRTQAEQTERARVRGTELAMELGLQQLAVRELKREMRQRLETLSYREASLDAKVASFEEHVHMYVCIYVCMYIRMYVCINYMYICIYVHVCMYIYMYIYTHTQGGIL